MNICIVVYKHMTNLKVTFDAIYKQILSKPMSRRKLNWTRNKHSTILRIILNRDHAGAKSESTFISTLHASMVLSN